MSQAVSETIEDNISERKKSMPEISRFYGIIISIFYDEHNPPHFHARYGKNKAAIDIRTLELLEGEIPPRALKMVKEWASRHQQELMRGWKLAQGNKPPEKISPLD